MITNNKDIRIRDAVVHFPVSTGSVKAVDHIHVTFESDKITGIIGESGCGKSVLGMYILGLLPDYAKKSGEIWYQGQDLETLSPRERSRLRGRSLGLIPQNPGDSLNPVRKIGSQIREALALVGQKSMVIPMLQRFGFSEEQAKRVAVSYPFQLSGGMQQRAVAAMGCASTPAWILADEPSKGLDMELRSQMYQTLELVRQQEVNGMLIITHDLVLAEKLCDCLAVMYAGQILEYGENVLKKPLHPYTQAILASLPSHGMHPMKGIAPAPGEYEKGCRFAPRCPYAEKRCFDTEPDPFMASGRQVRCYRYA